VRIRLAYAVIELALSPISNSAITAIDRALSDIQKGKGGSVPPNLKDAHYKGAAKLGRGIEYQYPHDLPNNWVPQQYLPEALKNASYYSPKNKGKFEDALGKQYDALKKANRSGGTS